MKNSSVGESNKGAKQKRIQIENYRQLVSMMAWRAWRRLPIHTRIWINPEDMISDGMWQAHRMTLTYNPNYANFTTALYHRLHKFYINDYLEFHSAQQRGWVRPPRTKTTEGKPIPHISMQAIEEAMRRKSTKASLDDVVGYIPSLVVSEDAIYRNAMTECFVVPALGEIYQNASFKLQVAIQQWFLTKADTRIHTKGKPFMQAAREFRVLCHEKGLCCNDCLHLVRSPGCLDMLSRNILGIPYDLEFPTPVVERVL